MGVLFGAGIRFLQDQQQRFMRAGLPVFLRIKNFDDSGAAYTSIGFQYSPTGGQITGFQDIQIAPPPEVKEVSLHNIGLNQTMLRFGARYFIVSHTFVKAQMVANTYSDPWQTWKDSHVVGLIYDGRLFEIVDITHEDVAGETISWKLTCNSTDRLVTAT